MYKAILNIQRLKIKKCKLNPSSQGGGLWEDACVINEQIENT